MAHTPRSRRQRGLTLIEAMLGAAVLAVGMLALLRFQPELLRHAEAARQRSEAMRLAQQDLEGLRALVTLEAFEAIDHAAATFEPDGLGGARFTLSRRVERGAWPGAHAVDVTVAWADRQGEPQQLTLSTLLAPPRPGLAAASLLLR